MVGRLRGFVHQMKTDQQFRAFHQGESQRLPGFYHRLYEDMLGPYAALLSEEDRQPVHQGSTRPTESSTLQLRVA
jgi:hypothetical protein